MQQFASVVVAPRLILYGSMTLILLKFTLQESALRDYGLGEFANTTTNDERGPVNESNVSSFFNMVFVVRALVLSQELFSTFSLSIF